MANAGAADPWRQDGPALGRAPVGVRPPAPPPRGRTQRTGAAAQASRPVPPLPPLPSAGRGPQRAPEDPMAYADAAEFARIPAARRPPAARGERRPDRGRPQRGRPEDGRAYRGEDDRDHHRGDDRWADPRESPHGPRGRTAPAPAQGGSRLRGIVAVLAVFLLTLGGGAVDSLFMGTGLGLITLGCLVGSTVLAAALVRRRDLLSVVVAPPLVFVAVACTNIAVAPSATFTLPTLATLLVRGFPTMAIATGAAVVVALVRWAARR